MNPIRFLFTLLVLAGLAGNGSLRADDAAAPTAESRLRDALKATMLQLRDAQNQVVTAQAEKDQADRDNAALKTQLDTANGTIKTLTETAAKNQADWDSAKAALTTSVTEKDREIATLNASLTQWKAAYAQVDSLQKTTEANRQKLALQVVEVQRLVVDREAKNIQLFQTANDILTRYEKFSLGEALTAKEPFTGIQRTKLQNLVAGYRDKLTDGIAPPPPKTAMVAPKVH